MICFQLFRTFFLIGLFSFGGGLASMELIRSRVVTQQAWLTDSEFTDIRIYYKYRNLDRVQGVLKGLRPAVAAMVLAAAVKLAGNAFWGGITSFGLPDTNWAAVAIAALFFVLLQKKKAGPVQAILASGVLGAVVYALEAAIPL